MLPEAKTIARAGRTLPALVGYEPMRPEAGAVGPCGGRLLGRYVNTGHGGRIEIGTRGFCVPGIGPLPYSSIADVRTLGGKEDATELRVELRDGRAVQVTFDGGRGRFRDVFEASRFLSRVAGYWADDCSPNDPAPPDGSPPSPQSP